MSEEKCCWPNCNRKGRRAWEWDSDGNILGVRYFCFWHYWLAFFLGRRVQWEMREWTIRKKENDKDSK